MNYVALSKTVARALRHAPAEYGLVPDAEGWVAVDSLLEGLRRAGKRWSGVTVADLATMIEHSDKRRYELCGGRIRALYGHSTPEPIVREPKTPPPILFHGTARRALDAISRDGLRPMRRQYVHLSVDRNTALQVARRRPPPHVLLTVDTRAAEESGVRFYEGNEDVWLADAIPPSFIREDAW